MLATPPNSARSSAGVTLDGLLDVRRVSFRGTWRGSGQRRALNFLNKAPGTNGISLFTSDWGSATPRISGAFSVVLGSFPPATPNTDLAVPVTSASTGSSVRIEPGTAVLVARGNAAAKLQAEAQPGDGRDAPARSSSPTGPSSRTRSAVVPSSFATARPYIGRTRASRRLSSRRAALALRWASARDGGIVLVTTDGRQPGFSVGMTNFELAQTLVRFGAVRGMALDGGGSSTLAFDGTVLNSPSDGKERAVSTALMLQYYGVYVPPPLETVVSPNGDGVAETQKLSYKVVRPSTVTATLTAPDGTRRLAGVDCA